MTNRFQSIVGSCEARGFEELAQHLATGTNLNVEESREILAAAARCSTAKPSLADKMRARYGKGQKTGPSDAKRLGANASLAEKMMALFSR